MQEDSSGADGRMPSYRVLVLNRNWQAVNIVDVRQGFAFLFQDRARVVYSDKDVFEVMNRAEWLDFSVSNPPDKKHGYIKTVHMRVRIPRILLLNEYDKVPLQEVKFSRENVFIRDHYTCQYCHKRFKPSELNLDHVIPRHRGGQTSWENIVTSCVYCNSKKANRLPHEAGMMLQKRPKAPQNRPVLSRINSDLGQVPLSWEAFLMRG